MFNELKRLLNIESTPDEIKKPADPRELAIAATALMIQIARADESEDEVELNTIVDYAVRSREIDRQDAELILEQARSQADVATSMYEFTEQLNDQLDQTEKAGILESIWRVAFADGRIDKYEEYHIRRIAELLNLNHREYVEARLRAETVTPS